MSENNFHCHLNKTKTVQQWYSSGFVRHRAALNSIQMSAGLYTNNANVNMLAGVMFTLLYRHTSSSTVICF